MSRSGVEVPSRRAARRWSGFTLIEMMVVVAVLGMAMTLVFNYDAMLPQAQLESTASKLQTNLSKMRTHALITQREVVFAYHIDTNTIEAWYPVEVDDDGRVLGPGVTIILDPTLLSDFMQMESVVLADGTERTKEDIELRISALGRMAAHRVKFVNPDFKELEHRWVEVDGLVNDSRVLEELPFDDKEEVNDASFR